MCGVEGDVGGEEEEDDDLYDDVPLDLPGNLADQSSRPKKRSRESRKSRELAEALVFDKNKEYTPEQYFGLFGSGKGTLVGRWSHSCIGSLQAHVGQIRIDGQ